MPSWFSDFELKDRVITVKSTGAQLPLSFETIGETLSWFPFYFA